MMTARIPVESLGSDRTDGRLKIYLQPGQLHVGIEPTTVTTILASCVAVCVFDARRRVGGMNHFLLPDVINAGGPAGRFGPPAIDLLLQRLYDLGGRPGDLRAKVFGGASVLAALTRPDRIPIGEQNSKCAFKVLAAAGIPVIASDVGGQRGRKVVFRTDDGNVLIKWL